MEEREDYYAIMGLNFSTFDDAKLKKAYKKLVLKHHPDKNEGKESDFFHKIQRAYTVLTDEQKKLEYDKVIKAKIFQQKKDNEMDVNRKRMKTKLEEKEREVKKRKMEEEKIQRDKEIEKERLRQKYSTETANLKKNLNDNLNNNFNNNSERENIKKTTTKFSREFKTEKDKSFAELFDIDVPSIDEFNSFEEKVFQLIDSLS